MVRHRLSLRDRVRTWWNEKSIPPAVLPIVGVVLSILLLIGLAFTLPPIIHDIVTPKVPEQSVPTPKATPSPEKTVPPVVQAPTTQPSPKVTQRPAPRQVPQPVPVGPQTAPQPVAPQPAPVAPQVPQAPQAPPVAPAPPVVPQPVPSLPGVVAPVVPPLLGPVLDRPLTTVDKLVKGVLGTVDNTVDKATGLVGGLLR